MRNSRKQAEEIIASGGSIIYQGVSYDRDNFHLFPTDADLAKNDKVEAVRVNADLDAEIEKLLIEKRKLAETLAEESEDKKTVKKSKDNKGEYVA